MALAWDAFPGMSNGQYQGNNVYNPYGPVTGMESAGNGGMNHQDRQNAQYNQWVHKMYQPPVYGQGNPNFFDRQPVPTQQDYFRQFVRARLGMGGGIEGREPKPQPGPMSPITPPPSGIEGREPKPNPGPFGYPKPEGREPRPRSLYDEIG